MRVLSILSLAVAFSITAGAAVNCTVNGAVPPTVRANGRAELVGDLAVVCSGTLPSATSADITVSLTTKVTSKAIGSPSPQGTEALLLVNEPGSGLVGAPATQIACSAADAAAGTCPAGANVFQGSLGSDATQVTFSKALLPTTGLSGMGPAILVLRITNLRGDITAGGPMVMATVSTSDPATLALSGGPVVVAFTSGSINATALLPDLSGPVPADGLALSQCVGVNPTLAVDPTSPIANDGVSFVVRVAEAYPTAFKNYSIVGAPPPDVNTRPAASPQNIPGQIFHEETGFYNPAFPPAGGLSQAGLATQATRIMLRFNSPPYGIQIHAPVYERGKGILDSRVRLVSTATDGSSPGYVTLGPLSPLNTYYTPSLLYVYEVTAKAPVNPLAIDTIDLPFYIAYPGLPYVTTGLSSVNVTLAPVSSDSSPFAASVPRFADVSVPMAIAKLTACAGTPALQALISSKSGAANGRVWMLGLNNYGTASATNAKITGLVLTQTFGAACTPIVATAFPLLAGTVAPSATASAAATIDFSACAATARFKVNVSYAADGGINGTSAFYNQFR